MLSKYFIQDFIDSEYEVFPYPENPSLSVIFRHKNSNKIEALRFTDNLTNYNLVISPDLVNLAKKHICSGKGFKDIEFNNIVEFEDYLTK